MEIGASRLSERAFVCGHSLGDCQFLYCGCCSCRPPFFAHIVSRFLWIFRIDEIDSFRLHDVVVNTDHMTIC